MNLIKKTTTTSFILEELKVRLNIGLFMILAWQLTRIVFQPIKDGGIMLVLYSLIEIVSIIVISRFCGLRNIGHDINEFNFYALLLHLIAIPAYYYTKIPVEYHNNGIWILFIASLVRLAYFGKPTEDGDYKGLPPFGLLSFIQRLYSEHIEHHKNAFTHWSELLFFGSAVPFWFIMWRTNDQTITITVIGLMVFIYLITGQMKQTTQPAAKSTESASFDNLTSPPDQLSITKKSTVKPHFDIANFDTALDDPDTALSMPAQHTEALNNTDPIFRGILVMLSKHFSQEFSIDAESSTNLHPQQWISTLRECQNIGQYQYAFKDELTHETFTYLPRFFGKMFDGRLIHAQEIKEAIRLVKSYDFKNLSHDEFLFIAKTLTNCWIKMVLCDGDAGDYMSQFDDLTEVTNAFTSQQA